MDPCRSSVDSRKTCERTTRAYTLIGDSVDRFLVDDGCRYLAGAEPEMGRRFVSLPSWDEWISSVYVT